MTDQLAAALARANTTLHLTDSGFRLACNICGTKDPNRQLLQIVRYRPTSSTAPAAESPVSGPLTRSEAILWLCAFTIGASRPAA